MRRLSVNGGRSAQPLAVSLAHWVGREVGGVRRAGRAGAVGLWRGGGGEGGSAKVARARAASHPPLPLGESFYPPPAWPRRLIGSRGPENWPLQLAYIHASSVHTLAGGGGREALTGSGPRRRVWLRAPAQRGRKRAPGAGTGSRSVRRGGCKRESSLSCSPQRGVLCQTYIAHSGEWREERGCFGGRKHLLCKSRSELSIRELQWSRRREGRTLL